MKKHLQYLRYILRHKWYVFVAGRKTGAPLWRLLVHDLSKFRPSEWGPYVNKFYGGEAKVETKWLGFYPPFVVRTKEQVARDRDAAFDKAWLLHQNRNPHHWQHWLLVSGNPLAKWADQSMDGGMTDQRLVRYERDGDGQMHPPSDRWGGEVVCDFRDCPNDPVNGWYSDEINARMNAGHLLSKEATLGCQIQALPMPEHFVREMVADWAGAGRAISGAWEVGTWYRKNFDNIVLHEDTRDRVHELLADHFSFDPPKRAEKGVRWVSLSAGVSA